MKRQRLIQIGTAGVAVVVVVFGIARGLTNSGSAVRDIDRKAAARQLTPVTGHDERGPVPSTSETGGNGIVEPADRELKLSSEVPGRISALLVKEGDTVEAGAVVVELAHAVESAALAAATGDVDAAQADLTKALNGQRVEEVDAAKQDAKAAKARADLSQDVFERTAKLAKTGAATVDDLDRAERQAASDFASYKSTEAKALEAARGSRKEDIDSAKARLASAAARREQAGATLRRLFITAPAKGQILQLKVRPGEYYNPSGSDPLLTMGDMSRLRVRLDVDEREFNRVHLGDSAVIVADAFPGRQFFGKVGEIGLRMGRKNVRTDDPTERIDTKIREVVVDLDSGADLLPGLRVTGYVQRANAAADVGH